MAGRPLRPTTDRRLGRPLPHQLANPTQAPPIVSGPKIPNFSPQGVCGINPSFLGLSPSIGQIPTRYSPVRRSTPGSKLPSFPLDLHVLGLPPAFNLSHDQTLQFNLTVAIALLLPVLLNLAKTTTTKVLLKDHKLLC